MKFTATDLIESTKNLAQKQEELKAAQRNLKAAESLDEAVRLNLFGPNAAREHMTHSSFIQENVESHLQSKYTTPDKRYAFLQRTKELYEQYDNCTTVDFEGDADAVALLLITGRELPRSDGEPSALDILPHDIAVVKAHSSHDGSVKLAEMMISEINNPDYWVKKS